MAKVKTSASRPSPPDTSARSVRAQIVAMARTLRCLFVPTAVLPSPRALPLSPNRRLSFQSVRFFRILVIALRMIVALTAVQISGVSHAVADVIVAVQGGDEYEHACPNDEDGRECPPGCPSCHCAHPMSALPLLAPPFVLDPLIPIEIAIAPYSAQSPPGPEPASLYRPPRAARG